MPVGGMAKLARVSVCYMKDVLKLQGMGYQGRIDESWTIAQCFADAGMERKRGATPKYRTDANACSCLGYWMAWDTRRGGNGAVRYAGGHGMAPPEQLEGRTPLPKVTPCKP